MSRTLDLPTSQDTAGKEGNEHRYENEQLHGWASISATPLQRGVWNGRVRVGCVYTYLLLRAKFCDSSIEHVQVVEEVDG